LEELQRTALIKEIPQEPTGFIKQEQTKWTKLMKDANIVIE
jgi:hypothetical protein